MRDGLVRKEGIAAAAAAAVGEATGTRGRATAAATGDAEATVRSAGRGVLRQTRRTWSVHIGRRRERRSNGGLGFGGNLHAGGGGERELGGDGAAVEVLERHRRDRLLLRHGRGRRGGRGAGRRREMTVGCCCCFGAPDRCVAPASTASEGLEEGGKGLCVALERRLGNFYAAALCTSTIFDGLRLRVRVSLII